MITTRMSLATILIPQSLDKKQALRLRRLGLAALSYTLTLGLLAVAWWFGTLATAAAIQVATAYLIINLATYAAIRSGFNLRFSDPSLTLFQMLVAITVAMFIAYNMNDGRSVALFGCFFVFLFGTFHLSLRQFAVATAFTLFAYAVVISSLVKWKPEMIHDIRGELMAWLILAGFLPCFSIVGGQVNALRRKSRQRAEELRLFTDNVPAMTVAYDANLRCQFVNRRFAEFFGLSVDQALSMHIRDVIGADNFRPIEHHYADVLLGRPVTYQRQHRTPGGELHHLEIRLIPHIGEAGQCQGCFSVEADITEYKEVEKRIQRLAHHDSLTGLPNRLLFSDRLNQAINIAKRDSSQFALLYIDLDKFKSVNDSLGHAAGDELLKLAASKILHQVRETDTVARVGGDEFIVILTNIALNSDAIAVVDKILTCFATPFHLGVDGRSVNVGASIGIAIYPSEGQDSNALVNAADAAMFRVKQANASLMAAGEAMHSSDRQILIGR